MSAPRDLDHSRRRARLRDRVLVTIARKEPVSLGELAKETKIRPSRLLGILEGEGREYARDLSLLQQGAILRVPAAGVRVYGATAFGREEAQRSVHGL